MSSIDLSAYADTAVAIIASPVADASVASVEWLSKTMQADEVRHQMMGHADLPRDAEQIMGWVGLVDQHGGHVAALRNLRCLAAVVCLSPAEALDVLRYSDAVRHGFTAELVAAAHRCKHPMQWPMKMSMLRKAATPDAAGVRVGDAAVRVRTAG